MKVALCTPRVLLAALWTFSALPGLLTLTARAELSEQQAAPRTILYITRHAEDVPELVGSDPSFTVTFNNCNADRSCCEEDLNPLGKRRAAALADWFQARGFTRALTHVIASHKVRTRQTVARIALLAGLGGDLDGDGVLDGTDVDQAPGDGVINIPPTPSECTPGFTSSSSARGPQRDYLAALPLGSRAVLCSHSTVIYPLLQDFGIDTSDPVKFPKDSRGRVSGFNNLWVVELRPVTTAGVASIQGRLLAHLVLDLKLGVSLVERPDPARSERSEKGDAK